MKKSLLLGSFAIFGLMANAQVATQATPESFEAAGMSSDKTSIAADVVFAEGDAGTIATAYADNWGTTNAYGNYKFVKVGDLEVELSSGAVGDSNPTFTSYADGAPTAGAVFAITPEADGWLTVFTKMNPNKQYVVFEGKTGPMSYTLGYYNNDSKYKIFYTLPADEDFYIDFSASDIQDYLTEGNVKPLFPWEVYGLTEKYETQDTGFLTFNVLGGNTYYFSALGSKAAFGTMVLTESEEEPVVTYLATEELPEVVFTPGQGEDGGAGVAAIGAQVDENAPVYNVLGQKVGADAKGILIQNGKKFIRR